MKKIPRDKFNTLKPEDQRMILDLGIEISDSPEKPSRRSTDSILEHYACIVETSCKLCKTIHTKVFVMEGVGGLLISNESTMQEIEGLTVKTRNETTITCPSCHDVLKLMCQEDLIALTLRVAKGEHRMRKEC